MHSGILDFSTQDPVVDIDLGILKNKKIHSDYLRNYMDC